MGHAIPIPNSEKSFGFEYYLNLCIRLLLQSIKFTGYLKYACLFHALWQVCLKKLEDNYTNNVFNAGADSKLGSYLNVRANVWKRFSLPRLTYYWKTMIARLIVRHFSFLANEQKLNSGPGLKWKFNFSTRLFYFEIVNYEWTSKMLLFFSQSWSWDNCYYNIFGVKIIVYYTFVSLIWLGD